MNSDEQHVPHGRLFDWSLTRRFLAYVRPYRLPVALALALLLLMNALIYILPIFVRHVIDHDLTPAAGLSAAQRLAGVRHTAALYLALASAGFALRFVYLYLIAWVGERVVFDLRQDVFSAICDLPVRYFDRTPVGRLLTRLTSDIETVQRLVSDGLVGFLSDLLTLVIVSGYMIYLSPGLSLLLLALSPAIWLVMARLNRRIREAHRAVRGRQSELNSFLQERLSGMTTVQLFNREAEARNRFDRKNSRLREALLRAIHWFSFLFPSIDALQGAFFSLVLAFGGSAILLGIGHMQIGVLVAFLMYIRIFFRPLQDLSDKTGIFQSAMAAGERLFALLDFPREIEDPPHPIPFDTFRGEIIFRDVRFAYREDEPIFENLSLEIPAGQAVALVGATGAGKSTLIHLVSRFYDVQRGAVLLDGRDIRERRQSDLRRRIGIVQQDPFLFADTIAANIGLHRPDLTRARIEESARLVNADGFIRALPQGYDTPVLERGVSLSTGQKQLLALARALAGNPDMLLVLDEATASVDTESERLIQEALRRLMRGRTSLVIAHRLSTIRHADRILVMRHGRIIEDGAHNALIRQGGYYSRLYALLSKNPSR